MFNVHINAPAKVPAMHFWTVDIPERVIDGPGKHLAGPFKDEHRALESARLWADATGHDVIVVGGTVNKVVKARRLHGVPLPRSWNPPRTH